MIEKLKRIHYMFYASLVFMGFPFISILLGEVPYWHHMAHGKENYNR